MSGIADPDDRKQLNKAGDYTTQLALGKSANYNPRPVCGMEFTVNSANK